MPIVISDPPDFLNSIAIRIYEEVNPIAYGDAENGYALAYFIQAWTEAMMAIESIVRDTDEGPGWSLVMNPATAPTMFLNWLAQFGGVSLIQGENPESLRNRIQALSGLRRGSPDAIKAEIRRTITDTQSIIFNERQGGNAWRLGIATIATETPNTAYTLAAILTQKPAGITLDYLAAAGVSYHLLRISFDTYQDVLDEYITYDDMRTRNLFS